jgi:hypothetical protein
MKKSAKLRVGARRAKPSQTVGAADPAVRRIKTLGEPATVDSHTVSMMRKAVPRSAHAEWSSPTDRVDPVQMLIDQGKSRIQSLLPVRYERMRADPFAFFRGAAPVMAADLAHTPASGLRMQACGDCHLANFGAYATPEGTPVFDLNDFDETLPAPFEWDVKRLATSLVLAGRVASMSGRACRKLARSATRSYREHIAAAAKLPPMVAWGTRIDLAAAIGQIGPARLRGQIEKRLAHPSGSRKSRR